MSKTIEYFINLAYTVEMGDEIPEPHPEEEYSGRFVTRVPRSLHRELVTTAYREGVSLKEYFTVGPDVRGMPSSMHCKDAACGATGILATFLPVTPATARQVAV